MKFTKNDITKITQSMDDCTFDENGFIIDSTEEEKHFHITLGGTYSVKAKSLKKAIKEVESWFDNCGVHVFAEETDDNMHCDYCCD